MFMFYTIIILLSLLLQYTYAIECKLDQVATIDKNYIPQCTTPNSTIQISSDEYYFPDPFSGLNQTSQFPYTIQYKIGFENGYLQGCGFFNPLMSQKNEGLVLAFHIIISQNWQYTITISFVSNDTIEIKNIDKGILVAQIQLEPYFSFCYAIHNNIATFHHQLQRFFTARQWKQNLEEIIITVFQPFYHHKVHSIAKVKNVFNQSPGIGIEKLYLEQDLFPISKNSNYAINGQNMQNISFPLEDYLTIQFQGYQLYSLVANNCTWLTFYDQDDNELFMINQTAHTFFSYQFIKINGRVVLIYDDKLILKIYEKDILRINIQFGGNFSTSESYGTCSYKIRNIMIWRGLRALIRVKTNNQTFYYDFYKSGELQKVSHSYYSVENDQAIAPCNHSQYYCYTGLDYSNSQIKAVEPCLQVEINFLCLQCQEGYNLQNGHCFKDCVQGTYLEINYYNDSQQCVNVTKVENCLTYSQTTDECLTCQEGYLLFNNICSRECPQQFQYNQNTKCVGECESPYSYLYDNQCLKNCPEKTINVQNPKNFSQFICKPCPIHCLNCVPGIDIYSIPLCIQCQKNFFEIDGFCFEKCPNKYHLEYFAQNNVQKCSQDSIICQNGYNHNCHQCKPSNKYHQIQKIGTSCQILSFLDHKLVPPVFRAYRPQNYDFSILKFVRVKNFYSSAISEETCSKYDKKHNICKQCRNNTFLTPIHNCETSCPLNNKYQICILLIQNDLQSQISQTYEELGSRSKENDSILFVQLLIQPLKHS